MVWRQSTQTPIHIHTYILYIHKCIHHGKLIAILAPPYYTLGTDNDKKWLCQLLEIFLVGNVYICIVYISYK